MMRTKFTALKYFQKNVSQALMFVSLGLAATTPTLAALTDTPSWIDNLRLDGAVSYFTTPKADGHAPFRDAIDGAKSSIFMEMFHLTDETIADALISAKQRGISVRVIFDRGGSTDVSRATLIEKMKKGGVDVQLSSSGFSITHTKAMVVDKTSAIISTMNLTDHPEARRDWGVVVTDAGVISEMNAVFEQDWTNAQNNTKITPPLQNANLIWSPVNSKDKLVTLIRSAKSSLETTVENLLSPDILNELIADAARGVKVQVLVPMCVLGAGAGPNYKSAKILTAKGVDIKLMPDPSTPEDPYLHGKMMLVDGARAYIGSINFSFNSLEKARELGVVLQTPDVLTGLATSFATDWDHASVVPDQEPSCKTATSNL